MGFSQKVKLNRRKNKLKTEVLQFLNFRTICVVHLCKSDKKSLHVSGYLLTKYVDLTMNNLYLNSNFSGLLSFYLGRKIHNDVSFRFVKHDFHPITYSRFSATAPFFLKEPQLGLDT